MHQDFEARPADGGKFPNGTAPTHFLPDHRKEISCSAELKTAQDDGIAVPLRDELYARMCALPEGHLFRTEDIVRSEDERADFAALRDYDYVHVFDGYMTRIVETRYVRLTPPTEKILDHYARIRGIALTETGDRTAWRMKLKEWEPIEGYRYYSTGEDEVLSQGQIKIRIIAAPDWIRADDRTTTLFRCFYDQPLKDSVYSIKRALARYDIPREEIEAVAAFARRAADLDRPADWASPALVAERIDAQIAAADADAK